MYVCIYSALSIVHPFICLICLDFHNILGQKVTLCYLLLSPIGILWEVRPCCLAGWVFLPDIVCNLLRGSLHCPHSCLPPSQSLWVSLPQLSWGTQDLKLLLGLCRSLLQKTSLRWVNSFYYDLSKRQFILVIYGTWLLKGRLVHCK